MAYTTTTLGEAPTHAEPVRRRRAGPRFLVWTAGIVVIGGMLIAVVLPSLCTSSETANRVKCASNLLQIGQGLTVATASASAIVAYEPLDNHEGAGTNVLFGDGHAQWVGKQDWPRVAAAAGVAVVASLTARP